MSGFNRLAHFFVKPSGDPGRIGIVSTVRNAEQLLRPFLEYHFSTGFSHVFLFFDASEDPGISVAQEFPNVTIMRRTPDLEKLWFSTRVFAHDERVRKYFQTEYMARQPLNVEVGINLARQQGISWLLHIDADELFYSPSASVTEHFSTLSARGYQSSKYLNHEAAPESVDMANCFEEVTLFKRNPALIQRPPTPSQETFPKPCYFHFYTNGKSAIRTDSALLPTGAHDFTSLRKFPWTKPKGYSSQSVSDPIILHYPCCGFENFRTKYRTLGNFSDKWWGTIEIRSRMSPFYVDSRDILRTENTDAARSYYEEWMVLKDSELIRRQLEHNRLTRITYPSQLLKGIPRRGSAA